MYNLGDHGSSLFALQSYCKALCFFPDFSLGNTASWSHFLQIHSRHTGTVLGHSHVKDPADDRREYCRWRNIQYKTI